MFGLRATRTDSPHKRGHYGEQVTLGLGSGSMRRCEPLVSQVAVARDLAQVMPVSGMLTAGRHDLATYTWMSA